MEQAIWQGQIHMTSAEARKDVIKAFKSDRGISVFFLFLFILQFIIGQFRGIEKVIIAISLSVLISGLVYYIIYRYFLHNKLTYSLYPNKLLIEKRKNNIEISISQINAVYSSINENGIGLVHIHYYDPAISKQKEYVIRYLDDYEQLTKELYSLINSDNKNRSKS